MGEGTSYTFGTFDNRSAVLHPITKAVVRAIGNIPLLIQHHAITTMKIVKDAGGAIVCNGQPRTRTVREWAARGQQAGGQGGANLHFIENSESQARRTHTHFFTPLSLTRYGGDLYDLDPLYNSTCTVGRDACANGCTCCCKQGNRSCDYIRHGLGVQGSFNLSSCVGRNIEDHVRGKTVNVSKHFLVFTCVLAIFLCLIRWPLPSARLWCPLIFV